MAESVRALGWLVRFMPIRHMNTVGPFYETGVGLPRLRSARHAIDWKRQDKDFFWLGECQTFETFYNGRVEAGEDDGDPDRSNLIPVLRTPDLDALVAEWQARGISPLRIGDVANGREAILRDPAGLLFAARQIVAIDSPQDAEAARRARRGEAFNPGCASLPALLQELGWVRRHVADVAGQHDFYCGILGLGLLARGEGWADYDLGDNIILELRAGGVVKSVPDAQMDTTGVFILRVGDTIALREKARAAGFGVVNELYDVPRGKLSYIADGEGNPVGLMQMNHPSRYFTDFTPASEDLEAERRWAEAQAGLA